MPKPRRTGKTYFVASTALPSPVEAYFEVANRCNSKCATCPLTFSPQENAKQLSLEEFKTLVDQLPDLRRAVMQGIGEPLLNRELAPMIRHLKQHGVYVVFNTNAALLTRRRQVELIESGGRVMQETRHWDEDAGITHTMRTKEEADDYRYFPEPDLVPVAPDSPMRERVRAGMPELPAAWRARLVSKWGIGEQVTEGSARDAAGAGGAANS